MMFCMSGCTGFFSNPVSLMLPPKSSGDIEEVEQALSKVASNYEFSYPASGDNRNAITIRDFNLDGKDEALVFYQTVDENNAITVHMGVFVYDGETRDDAKWTLLKDVLLSGTGIDRFEFIDVCDDDSPEVFIGCKLYNAQEQELNIYDFNNSDITLLSQERYTDYCVGDLIGTGKNQVILFKIANQTETVSPESVDSPLSKTVSAKLLSLSYEDVDSVPVVLGTVDFDGNITSFSNISLENVADDKKGVVVDAYVGGSAMITEVFYYDETLKASFYNKRTASTDATYRESLIASRDINGDKIIEIPKTYVCQGYDMFDNPAQKVYFTEWYNISGKKLGERVACGFINTADNYFLQTPATWLGKITVQRNFDERERVFCEWDFTKQTYGQTLFSVRVFLKSEFKENSRNYTKVNSDDEYVYAVKINEDANFTDSISVEYLKENIILL